VRQYLPVLQDRPRSQHAPFCHPCPVARGVRAGLVSCSYHLSRYLRYHFHLNNTLCSDNRNIIFLYLHLMYAIHYL
jgi:hypothetical protein